MASTKVLQRHTGWSRASAASQGAAGASCASGFDVRNNSNILLAPTYAHHLAAEIDRPRTENIGNHPA